MQLEDILAAVLSPDNLRKYQYELAAMAAALLYMLFYLRGERQIRQLAKQTTRHVPGGSRGRVCAEAEEALTHLSALQQQQQQHLLV